MTYMCYWLSAVYIQPLLVTTQKITNTTLSVSWSEPQDLTHGIYSGVEIFYRLNESAEKHNVMVEQWSPLYEIRNLQPYSWYAISVRPHTLEGTGKVSEEILARTKDGCKGKHLYSCCLFRVVFNWVSKVISELLWFIITSLSDWFKVLAPLSQPIRSETKTNRGLRVHIFPRFVSATCNYFEFWLVNWIVSDLFDWPK